MSNKVDNDHGSGATSVPDAPVALLGRPERRLIRHSGSFRHIVYSVGAAPAKPDAARLPLTMALVLDRSGSMHGNKLQTAKQAALAVLDRLEERDRAALVVFDDRIDVVQPCAPVTPALRARLRAALSAIEARGSTALHEGWLTGCHAIADEAAPVAASVSRCFLLTDGQANQGETDVETIAGQVAAILEHAGIGTSTFGIGDYNELLLGPMAAAGGGQFHHLRSSTEIASTFVGELGDLLSVAVRSVRLEIEAAPALALDVVGEYRSRRGDGAGTGWVIPIGDLLAGESRPLVIRLGFPPYAGLPTHVVRARLHWLEDGRECSGPWQETPFSYAGHAACDEEIARRDPELMRTIGQQHAFRARLQATSLAQHGNQAEARTVLQRVAQRIAEYAGADAELHAAIASLREAEHQFYDKEAYYQTHRMAKGHRDHRGPEPDPPV